MSTNSITPASLAASDLLANKTQQSTRAKSPVELTHAAGEFESMLLTQWLQGAESSFGGVPGSDNDADAAGEQMKNFGVQVLAKSLADRGGIGLGKVVTRALQASNSAIPIQSRGKAAGD